MTLVITCNQPPLQQSGQVVKRHLHLLGPGQELPIELGYPRGDGLRWAGQVHTQLTVKVANTG